LIRIDEKKALIDDCCGMFRDISRYSRYIPNRLFKAITRSITKDFVKGLKIIDRKNPIFIEMPQLQAEGNGMYSENVQNIHTENKEIIVTTPTVFTNNPPNSLQN